jgi:hypothetical protein
VLRLEHASGELRDERAALQHGTIHVLESGERCAVGRTDRGPAGWFEDVATVLVDLERTRILATAPLPGRRLQWEHRVLEWAVPLLLSHQDHLCLHGCAVVGNRGAIVLCGPSGRGKTSTAQALQRQGFPMLADDISVLTPPDSDGRRWVTPGPIGARVPRSNGGKEYKVSRAIVVQAPLVGFGALAERGSRFAARPLAPSEAFLKLLPSLVTDSEAFPRGFASLAAVTRRVTGAELRMPDDLDALPVAAAEAIGFIEAPPPA